MGRRLVSSGSPFETEAGYSRAVFVDDMAFVAGTTGYEYGSMAMPDDVGAQTANALATIQRALAKGGFAMADVVRATYYVTDISEAAAVFERTGQCFGDIRPAATIVEVSRLLRPEMKVEIEVTAKRG